MKCSLLLYLLSITICQLTIAGDAPESDQEARMKKTFEACMQTIKNQDRPLSSSSLTKGMRRLKECEADYTVEATTYTKQPLISAISHLKDFDQGYSANDTRVYGLQVRCRKGNFPFKSKIVTTDQPLLFVHAIDIMKAVQEREVSSEIDN